MLVQLYGNSSLVLPLTGYSLRGFKLIIQKNMNPTLQLPLNNLLFGKLVSNMARQWLRLCKNQGASLGGSKKQIAAFSTSKQIDKLT